MLEVLPFGEDPDLSGTAGPAVPQHLPPCPRPSRFPSGNLSGLRKSLGRQGWISQYLPRLGGARIHCMNNISKKPSVSEIAIVSHQVKQWFCILGGLLLQLSDFKGTYQISHIKIDTIMVIGLCTFSGHYRPRYMVLLRQFHLTTRALNLQALSILPPGNFSAKEHPQFLWPRCKL